MIYNYGYISLGDISYDDTPFYGRQNKISKKIELLRWNGTFKRFDWIDIKGTNFKFNKQYK